ncbi:MAG: hypothetical protein WC791_03855 [Candidatus Paceibacterota bacterium]|jgi:non-homologous end joining protein Ku
MNIQNVEPLSVQVGKFLLSKGLGLASATGFAEKLKKRDVVGILKKFPNEKPRTYFLGFIKRAPLRMFLGVIWFRNEARSANEQRWVFEVQGKENLNFAKELAEEMAQTFDVKIVFRLECEKEVEEKDSSNFEFPLYP